MREHFTPDSGETGETADDIKNQIERLTHGDSVSPTQPDFQGVEVPDTVHAGFEKSPPLDHERPGFDQGKAAVRDSHQMDPERVDQRADGRNHRTALVVLGSLAASALVGTGAYLMLKPKETDPTASPQPHASAPATPGQKASPSEAEASKEFHALTPVAADPRIKELPTFDQGAVANDTELRAQVFAEVSSPVGAEEWSGLIKNNHANVNAKLATELKRKYPNQFENDYSSGVMGIGAYTNSEKTKDAEGLANFIYNGSTFNADGKVWTIPTEIANSFASEHEAYTNAIRLVDPSNKARLGTAPVFDAEQLHQAVQSGDATELFKNIGGKPSFREAFVAEVHAGNTDPKLVDQFAGLMSSGMIDPGQQAYRSNQKDLETLRKKVLRNPNDYANILAETKDIIHIKHVEVLAARDFDPSREHADASKSPVRTTVVTFYVTEEYNGQPVSPQLYAYNISKAPVDPADQGEATLLQATYLTGLTLGQ